MKYELLLTGIPKGLREELLCEFDSIVQNFLSQKWRPSELSGGRLSEVVYTIVHGHLSGRYLARSKKPRNMVEDCKALEQFNSSARSMRILIPRLLPALYEIRNNRNVGHVGGDLDPNLMDSSLVLNMASWIMCELIRVYHGVTIHEAQKAVTLLSELRIPIIWTDGNVRRVLDTGANLQDQVLLLLLSCNGSADHESLRSWTECKNKGYFKNLMKKMHKLRLVEFDQLTGLIQLLPPGSKAAAKIIAKLP